MKNIHILAIFLLPMIYSCGTMRISKAMHTPNEEFLTEIEDLSDSLNSAIAMNQLVIEGYNQLDKRLCGLYGRKIKSIASLNLSASVQIKNNLINPPKLVKLTDKLKLTRVNKSLSLGNTYIFKYVHDIWSTFANHLSQHNSEDFEELWTQVLEEKADFRNPNSFQLDSDSKESFLKKAFRKYHLAWLNKERWSDQKFHETILEGNLYFFLIEQLVAQNFIRKALTIRPLGSNPFNMAGRKVEVILEGREYKNLNNSPLDLSEIASDEVRTILSKFDALGTHPVKYHKYEDRLPFILAIGVKEHLLFMENQSPSLAAK